MAGTNGFSQNALRILKARYFKKDKNGKLLDQTPSHLFQRVAQYIASAEKSKKEQERWAQKFFEVMMGRDFFPNSPTLTGAGRQMCLSACFVLPIEDSMESIFETIKNTALVHKEGGGTGFGNLYVTISYLNQKPFEVFASIGKSGYSTMADVEALGRLISLAMRSGVDSKEIIAQLKGIGGSKPIFTDGGLVQSLPDAIAKVLERHIGEAENNSKDLFHVICKVCGASLPDEKCPTCPNCGWNRCSGT